MEDQHSESAGTPDFVLRGEEESGLTEAEGPLGTVCPAPLGNKDLGDVRRSSETYSMH